MRDGRRFWSKVKKSRGRGCFMWLAGKDDHGYGLIWWKGKMVRAHRLAFELTYGPLPPGLLACHRCDTPGCVRPDHLFAGTHADNARDASVKNRVGLLHRKLTWGRVTWLRRYYAAAPRKRGLITRLAEDARVSRPTMSAILARKSWVGRSQPIAAPRKEPI